MSDEADMIVSRHGAAQGRLSSYVTGFALSVLLTCGAFVLAAAEIISGWAFALTLAGLAITQLFIQLRFFLHLGKESKPRWNLVVFSFAAIVIVILVFGSLWIMKNLNYHAMPSMKTDKSIMENEGIKR